MPKSVLPILPQDLSPQLRYAMYMPAISPGYGEMAILKATQMRPMPAGLAPSDLNFLDPNSKLFYLPAVLYSSGIVADLNNPPPTMITGRDTKHTYVLGDSGGFQIISGNKVIKGSSDRQEIYDWQRRFCDCGMTLDVPTKAIDDPNSHYMDFDSCLTDTLDHLSDYDQFYGAAKVPLLNVLQGRDLTEADDWYHAVKGFKFDGWAIAGPVRLNVYWLMHRILMLLDEGRLGGDENWVHFLGVSQLKIGVLLTIIRDCVREKLKDDVIHFSMDTSSPGLVAMKFREVYTNINLTNKKFSLSSKQVSFNNPKHLGSSQPFPYRNSPIGRALTMGDLIVKKGTHMDSRLDMLSACMLANHNYYVISRAFMMANDELNKHRALNLHTVPNKVFEAKCAIEDIFAAKDPWAELAKRQTTLERV